MNLNPDTNLIKTKYIILNLRKGNNILLIISILYLYL